MAIQNRTTTLPGIWAENAQTTIPIPPVAGVTYRDTTLNSTAIDKAWPFKTVVDSSDFNQHAFLQDTLIKEAEQYGIMRWNNTTSYKEGGFCLGQDGKLYQAKRDNQGKEPTANVDDWKVFYPDLSPYQLKSNISQVIDSSTEKYPSNKAVQDIINSSDLTNKANTDLSNVTTTGLSQGYFYIGKLLIQWGNLFNTAGATTTVTINLKKPYANTNYSLAILNQSNKSGAAMDYDENGYVSKSTTEFIARIYRKIEVASIDWITIGMGA